MRKKNPTVAYWQCHALPQFEDSVALLRFISSQCSCCFKVLFHTSFFSLHLYLIHRLFISKLPENLPVYVVDLLSYIHFRSHYYLSWKRIGAASDIDSGFGNPRMYPCTFCAHCNWSWMPASRMTLFASCSFPIVSMSRPGGNILCGIFSSSKKLDQFINKLLNLSLTQPQFLSSFTE